MLGPLKDHLEEFRMHTEIVNGTARGCFLRAVNHIGVAPRMSLQRVTVKTPVVLHSKYSSGSFVFVCLIFAYLRASRAEYSTDIMVPYS